MRYNNTVVALVTGARGFIGRHLAISLHRKGIYVCGIGHGSWTESECVEWGLSQWLNGDVTKSNLEILQDSVGTPDIVFHLAGGSSVAPSIHAPVEDFRRSVLSTLELLEWARVSAPKARLVLASSAAVYGSGYTHIIQETNPLRPYSPYGVHKRIAEELFESYGKNFGLNVAFVRLFSVYGTEIRKQLLWDSCCRLANDSTALELGGSGKEVRDWFHVSDAVKLLRMAATKANSEGFVINGGTGDAVTVCQIARQLCTVWGMGTKLEFNGRGRQGDPQYLVADTTKASILGFVPKVGWKEGLAYYVEWFKHVNLGGKI